MIKVHNGFIVEHSSELPRLQDAKVLYMDFETTSGENSVKAFHARRGHSIAGIACAADDSPVFYIPTGHRYLDGRPQEGNIEGWKPWLKEVVGSCAEWCNHNVKFDAHFADMAGATFNGSLYCTLAGAKLLDADRLYKGGYGLDVLSRDWFSEDISHYNAKIKTYLDAIKLPRNKKAHDYGLLPISDCGEYAIQDVHVTKALRTHIQSTLPDECREVHNTEQKVVACLFDVEKQGMRVNIQRCQEVELSSLVKMCRWEERLKEILGREINPTSANDCYDVLCNHYGLPILSRSEDTGNPSFDKDALKQYLRHPSVKGPIAEVVDLIRQHRKSSTLLNFFVKPYQELAVDGIMYPEYNPSVRSCRMSCKKPNAQQLDTAAKHLVEPLGAFLSCDYSQIEFRIICHYIRDEAAIAAYTKDPDTDFHQWVANLCGIERDPAKSVNFACAFGAGKCKVLSMLQGNMTLMTNVDAELDKAIAEGRAKLDDRALLFEAMCEARAKYVYQTYHNRLPGIKQVARDAANIAASRGYARSSHRRHLHLPPTFAHIAFNRTVQASAAEVLKERFVAIAPRFNAVIRDLGITITALVHDEFLFDGPRDVIADPHTHTLIASILENVDRFVVPMRIGMKRSDQSWADCDSTKVTIGRSSDVALRW